MTRISTSLYSIRSNSVIGQRLFFGSLVEGFVMLLDRVAALLLFVFMVRKLSM
jgi:hypothetical protein